MPRGNKKPRNTTTPEEVSSNRRNSLDQWITPMQTSRIPNRDLGNGPVITLTNAFETLSPKENDPEEKIMSDNIKDLVIQVNSIAEKQRLLERSVEEHKQSTSNELKKVNRRLEDVEIAVRKRQALLWGYPMDEYPITINKPPEEKRETIYQFFRKVLKVPEEDLAVEDIDDVWYVSTSRKPVRRSKNHIILV